MTTTHSLDRMKRTAQVRSKAIASTILDRLAYDASDRGMFNGIDRETHLEIKATWLAIITKVLDDASPS